MEKNIDLQKEIKIQCNTREQLLKQVVVLEVEEEGIMSELNSNVIKNKSQVISGIYKIENLINHKVYIGQSKDIYQRWYTHKRASFNKNCREHNYPLYRAIRKYGIENFSFEIIKETYDLDYWEIFLIQIYHSLSNEFGYNLREGGNGTFILTEEQKLNWIDLHKKNISQ